MASEAGPMERVVVHGMDVHPTQAKQPPRNVEVPVGTSLPKRVVVDSVDVVHAAQEKQALRKLQAPALTGQPKCAIIVTKGAVAPKQPPFASTQERPYALTEEEECRPASGERIPEHSRRTNVLL
jgi:hypothetical protein